MSIKNLSDALPDSNAYASMQAAENTDMEVELVRLRESLQQLSEAAAPIERAKLHLAMGRALAKLQRGEEGWALAKPAFDVYLAEQDWEMAADACDVLFECEQDEGSLSALGQGVWLAVTFPIDPQLTISLLDHIIDETPDDSDGAAVAAATAVYIADMRSDDAEYDNLGFFSRQLLGRVARRHSNVESQDQFDAWMMRMELNEPEKFLIRLRNVVDVLVQEDWWFDRDALRDQLPE